ncbi:MAG: glycosyltransferase family 4 protein [Butyrivibrio sp.]|nr:glycosyltransferase family 4 protein [Butyrivibrio sp.]
MKICVFCHSYKALGANLSLIDWLKDTDKTNCVYYVVIPKYDKEFISRLRDNGIDNLIIGHYRVATRKLYHKSIRETIKESIKFTYSKTFNNLFDLILCIKLRRLKVDIIHSNSFAIIEGVKIARWLKIPHVWHIRELMKEDHEIEHYDAIRVLQYADYSHAIFISNFVETKYKQIYNFKSSKVIYNRVFFDSSYVKKRRFMQDGICNLLFVGSLQKKKGLQDALECVKKMNAFSIKCTLTVCGIGGCEKEYKNYCIDNSLDNVRFLGFRNDILDIRKNMDIAFMCSDSEAFGRTTIEGQYYENLVIGADAGCTKYLIKNYETGLLYDKNKNNLFDVLCFAINNYQLVDEIICNAKEQAVARFSGSIIGEIEEIYNEVI